MAEIAWVVEPASSGDRLDKFLAHASRLGSRGRAADALARRRVFLNDVEMAPADRARPLAAGDRVRYWADRPGSARKSPRPPRQHELAIVYEDDAIVVVNKPAGLLTVPLDRREDATSVQDELVRHLRSRGKKRPLVVHRIDRDTSGLVVFALRPDAQARLREQFRRHEPERVYLAVVYGHPDPAAGAWVDHLVWDDRSLIQKETHPRDPKGQEARSEYRILERLRGTSLIEVRLTTGRRNQIRIQARLRGYMLVGEARYTYGPDVLRPVEFARQALHAYRLGFRHPLSGRRLSFEAPVPADMQGLIDSLR